MLEITNLTTNLIDEEFLKKIADLVLTKEGKEGVVSLVLVGPGRIKQLNKKYRGKNKVTDVLSFGQAAESEFKEIQDENFLGEIVICLRAVKKTAKREGSTFEKELARVLIHGILHLLGYDHKKPEQAQIMEEKQNKYLQELLT
ncbi:rRNA maturation RNase YbeY [bacterium]|nr:rRNA maturation RNase YbeY [bacterium]